MLIQLRKTNLGHCCEAVSEGDAESRETRRRMCRPEWETVKHEVAGQIGDRAKELGNLKRP